MIGKTMQTETKPFWKSPWGIALMILALLLCCCLIALGVGAYGLYQFSRQLPPEITNPIIQDFITPTPAQVTRVPAQNIPLDTLQTLEDAVVPVNDPIDLAERLGNKPNVPATVPSGPFSVGATQSFWASNVDSNENFQVEATLRYETAHSYFWVENGVSYKESELRALADAFETKIYPTDREFFGSEWTPGVDGDPHIYILYARGLGGNLAGYFSSADELHPLAHEYSNAHEMFVFNADNTNLGDQFTYGVLAHEFQHMIHWYQDRNETSWLNEGASELAAFLNGYDIGGFDWLFTSNPDLQLTDWPNDPSATSPHYGAGFLFTNYFLNRFGDAATQALVRHPKNGMDSVSAVLDEIQAKDPLSGQPISADQFFAEWTIANYLNDAAVGDGRFAYANYPALPTASETETISSCPGELNGRTVNQYAADYIRITCSGTYSLRFEGASQTKLLPADAHTGRYAFWSNKGDESDMTLTREFDLSSVSGAASLSYWAWYDLEKDYDYLYLVASTDGGQSWQIITTPSGTAEDISGNSYGWGYNGESGGWKQEKVDLSAFAGKKVTLRFEYVTDAAVNGEGFLLDDISLPEAGYSADFESDDGGWQATGFARVENILPQKFSIALIKRGATTSVEILPVPADGLLEIPLTLGGDVSEVTVVVSGLTPFTREKGAYNLSVR